MVRVGNFIVTVLNFVVLILGLFFLAFAAHSVVHGGTNCQKALLSPLLIIGGFLFLVALLGLIGSLCGSTSVMFIYLALMFLLIIALLAFTIFAFLVTNKGAGYAFSGRGYKEHRTGDYSNWLRNHFVNDRNWNGIKSCLISASVCAHISDNQNIFSNLESGCCKPPTACGFEKKNATAWVAPAKRPAVNNPDCEIWNNDQRIVCYNCDSCKAGVLENIREEWRKLAVLNGVLIIVVTVVYGVGCCARREIMRDNSSRRFTGFK